LTYTIVATGNSSQNWTPNGYSIGVNDAWKFGKPTDGLLICNRPQQFSSERLKTITDSKPKHFYSNMSNWAGYFDYFDKSKASRHKKLYSNNPELPTLKFMQWSGTLYPDAVFYSNSSPIIALTLAYNLGAKEIILWGVDFKNHHLFHEGNLQTKKEVQAYLEVFECLREKGVSIYRGADGSVFDGLLPLKRTGPDIEIASKGLVDLQMTDHFDNYLK
jgi:hypothetical protein